jgi:uncharacterized low-complexity protein
MNRQHFEKKLGLAAGASVLLVTLPQAHAAGNPFELPAADGATIVVADSGEQKGISVLEGKCGSGKCGAERVREMMDKNADGSIDRDEYLAWSADIAGREFEEMAKGSAAIAPDDVYEHYRSLEFHNQG